MARTRSALTPTPPRSARAATRYAFIGTATDSSSLRAWVRARAQYLTPENGSVSLRESKTISATATSFRCSW